MKVVFTFGRMNPPTTGHQKLVDKLKSVARGSDVKVYLSHSQNNKKDPLDYNTKQALAKRAFGSIVTKSNAKTIIQVLQDLEKSGYTDITMVVGSDRVAGFKDLLNKYNGKDYTFKSIKVVSAGQRDPDADDVSGMSASKMRALAKEGKFAEFKNGLPKAVQPQAKKVYDKLRSIMEQPDNNEAEQLDEYTVLNTMQRLKRARMMKRIAKKVARMRKIRSKRMADTNRLHKRSRKKALQAIRARVAGSRGKSYGQLGRAEKITVDKLVQKKSALIDRIAKRLLPKVRKAEVKRLAAARSTKKEELELNNINQLNEVKQDTQIKDRDGSQPAKYHSGLKKSTKEKRDAQFQKGAEKSHKDPSAYPEKHAGDEGVKTKMSKHTKKYKDMFGEAKKCTKEGGEAADFDMDADDMAKRKSPPAPTYYQRGGVKTMKDMPKVKTFDENPPKGLIKAGYEVDGEYPLTEESKGALQKKADKSGIPYSILKKVYDRGMAAWRTGHRPGAGQEQWAYARVNSFITKGKGTWGGADKDLASKVKKEEVEFNEACWDGYKQEGMKKKGDKVVPNCVKNENAEISSYDKGYKSGYGNEKYKNSYDVKGAPKQYKSFKTGFDNGQMQRKYDATVGTKPNSLPVKEEYTQKDITKFHTALDKLVHKSFGKRQDETVELDEIGMGLAARYLLKRITQRSAATTKGPIKPSDAITKKTPEVIQKNTANAEKRAFGKDVKSFQDLKKRPTNEEAQLDEIGLGVVTRYLTKRIGQSLMKNAPATSKKSIDTQIKNTANAKKRIDKAYGGKPQLVQSPAPMKPSGTVKSIQTTSSKRPMPSSTRNPANEQVEIQEISTEKKREYVNKARIDAMDKDDQATDMQRKISQTSDSEKKVKYADMRNKLIRKASQRKQNADYVDDRINEAQDLEEIGPVVRAAAMGASALLKKIGSKANDVAVKSRNAANKIDNKVNPKKDPPPLKLDGGSWKQDLRGKSSIKSPTNTITKTEEVELDEAPLKDLNLDRLIKIGFERLTKGSKIDKAITLLKDIVDRKLKETGSTVKKPRLRHALGWYASAVAQQYKLDSKGLANSFLKKHPQYAMTEEVIVEDVKEISTKNHKKKMLKDILPKSGAGQDGTDEVVKNYKNATPGQGGDVNEEVLEENPLVGLAARGAAAGLGKLAKSKWWNKGRNERIPNENKASVKTLAKDDISQMTKSDKAFKTGSKKLSDLRPHKAFSPKMIKTGPSPAIRQAVERPLRSISRLGEAFEYHIENELSLKENVYRPHSEEYYNFFCEARRLWTEGAIELNDPFDIMLMESDAGLIGKHRMYGEVPLDIPLINEEAEGGEDQPLNKPRRGGSKKFYVYVKDPSTGNIKKVSFGDTTGLKAKIDNPEARKSFVARHQCAQKKDKTKPGYWACRLPYYAKELGLEGGGSFFW